jgi:hypothetical protein
VGKSKDAPAVAASGRSSKAEGPGGTRKSAREAGGNAKADGKTSAKSSKEPKSEAAAAAARPKGAKGGAKKEADAPAAADADADASAKPKLPRPEGVAPCPRCHSEETKFCYYNNYNVKQPRYFCRGCQRYWTAGGMLRNVPVGAGRRKNKNGIANGAGEDEDASIAAGRILAGVAGAANPLHQLAPLAAAASAARRDRRGGSSDGSATEADGDVNAASGANPALSAQWPMAAAAAQQAGMMNHFATAAAGAFGNPFAAMQAAAMQQATGGYNPDALQGVVAAQMAMFAHAQAQAQGGAGQEAAAAAAQAQARAFAVAQQGVFANAAAAAAAAAQSQRATPNPFAAAAHAFGAAAAGSPSTSSAANGGPIKPTASGGFAALPPHLQRQLSGAESLPGSPRAGASATNAAAPAHSAAAAPADAAAAAAAPQAGTGSPNLSAMMMVMGPAIAAMQQQHAAAQQQQQQQQQPNAAAAAAAAAAGGAEPPADAASHRRDDATTHRRGGLQPLCVGVGAAHNHRRDGRGSLERREPRSGGGGGRREVSRKRRRVQEVQGVGGPRRSRRLTKEAFAPPSRPTREPCKPYARAYDSVSLL